MPRFIAFLILEIKIKWTDVIRNDGVFQRAEEVGSLLNILKIDATH